MKKNNIQRFLKSLTLAIVGGIAVFVAYAAVSPSLFSAASYGVLSSTYTNTLPGTTISGDVGFTTGPAVAPLGAHPNYGSGAPYATAGTNQATALTNLNSQLCTFVFPAGAIDLASDITHGPVGVYTPGVYCILGATTIGGGGTITLNGTGTYIFRSTGALDTTAGSIVALSGGASACDVWWTPAQATTLGASSIFKGNVIDDAGITVGSTVNWVGRALSFGGTVTTDTNVTIAVPVCLAPTPATLTITKSVVNNNGGVKVVADFPLFVGGVLVTSGVATTTLSAGTYTITETNLPGYTAGVWGGDCSAGGSITLANGDNKTCTITNDDNAPVVPVLTIGATPPTPIIPKISIKKVASVATLSGPGPVTYTYTVTNTGSIRLTEVKVTDDKCAPITLITGDDNRNNILGINEVWTYRCTSNLSQTTTNTATVIGYSEDGSHQLVTDMALATVIVNNVVAPIVTPVSPQVPIVQVPIAQVPIPQVLGVSVTFPDTGIAPEVVSSQEILVLLGALLSLLLWYVFVMKKIKSLI